MSAAALIVPLGREASVPPERRGIARDEVRLLVSDRAGRRHADRSFRDLPLLLRCGDLLVANDSGTLPAALTARRADGTALGVHLSARIAEGRWIVEPRAALVAAGERVDLPEGAEITFVAPVDAGNPRLWYATVATPLPLETFLARHGRPIRYGYVSEGFPLADYQTIFARTPGSAEMPSAGRPFSARVVDGLAAAGVRVATLTLHAGVSSAERSERPMREPFRVPESTASAVNETRLRGGRVIAIGTTVVRALESAARRGAAVASAGWTDLIVTPERGVALVDGLLTGFHEPEASHLDLLRAFLDDAALRTAYIHAADSGYLWHEFGDLHLVF
jgi:S-adenosylmethionine:tRNA ribosyltransferase-isomerase